MVIKQFALFALSFGTIASINATLTPSTQIITFQVMKYPTLPPKNLTSIDIQPANLEKKIIKKRIHAIKTPHIYANYGGNLSFSGTRNRITFPRHTQKAEIDVIVTQQISPIFLESNNISHWIIDKNSPRDHYRLTRQHNEKTGTYFWDCKKLPVTTDNVVPLHSIIIFAKPKNILIPTGITLTDNSPQFILPPVYVRAKINHVANAAFVHSINMFFDPIRRMYKSTKKTVAEHIKT